MITYPVSPTARFTFKLAGDEKRGMLWPRADGEALLDPAVGLVVLEESIASLPEFDPATHKLDAGQWIDDEAQETAVFTRNVVALTQVELDVIAAQNVLTVKRNLVKEAIPVLRNWSTQAAGITVTTGNAVNVLQGVVDNLETFYSRFADLLEVLRMDK